MRNSVHTGGESVQVGYYVVVKDILNILNSFVMESVSASLTNPSPYSTDFRVMC